MLWNNTNNEHDAVDNERSTRDRYHSIDQFLFGALARIGEAYSYKNCSAILFDILSCDRLLVIDSPDGLVQKQNEKISAQLTSPQFSKHCMETLDKAADEFGDRSYEYENAELKLEEITWDSVKTSIANGKARIQLDKFDQQPRLIVLTNSDDRLTHDLVTGDRVAMQGAPIESQSVPHCQCRYCERLLSNMAVTKSAFEVAFFANEPQDVARSATYQTVEGWFDNISNGEIFDWNTNAEFERLLKAIDHKYPKRNMGSKSSPWSRWLAGNGYLLLTTEGNQRIEVQQFIRSMEETNAVIAFYPTLEIFETP